jgi:hypothetical protein
MTFYLIFDKYGKLLGFTEDKKVAKKLVEQREDFQTLHIEKFTEKMMNDKVKQDLHLTGSEIFKYFGVYLFEHEEDDVYHGCFEYYTNSVNVIEGYLQALDFIKLTDEEKKVLEKYSAMMLEVGERMTSEYYLNENPQAKMLKIKKVILKILKDGYKGDNSEK